MTGVFSGPCEFIAGAQTPEQLPPEDLPEIAFAGRSNVGKSSLINALTGRKALARTSHTPGRTQQINFFSVGGVFTLVDMPGYGYAQVSKARKKAWEKLIRDYLRGRGTLRGVFLLVDARHDLKDSDREMMRLLGECAVPFRVVLTKTDQATEGERKALGEALETEMKTRPAAWPQTFPTSAHSGSGIIDLRTDILRLCN